MTHAFHKYGVNWLTMARLVLADPPLTRLSAADGRLLASREVNTDLGNDDRAVPVGQRAANHSAAIALLGQRGELADGHTLEQYFLQNTDPQNAALQVTTLDALYWHSRRSGQPPAESLLLAAVTALARDGSGAARQHAVQLLGRFPAPVTAALLRELARDPTNTVCCTAERALAEQAWDSASS